METRVPGIHIRALSAGWCLALVLAPVGTLAGESSSLPPVEGDIEVFTRKGCPFCTAARQFLDALSRQRPGLDVQYHDVGENQEALEKLLVLAEHFGVHPVGVPAFYVRGELLIGFSGPTTTGQRLIELLSRPPPEGFTPPSATVNTRWFGELSLHELGLPAFTFALGLIDGCNPCAMWVLLFLLSLLVNLRDRTKMALIAGTFVGVSGLVYFLFMAAWLNLFLFIGFSRAIQVGLGVLACGIGGFNVKDFVALRKGVSPGIPGSVKPRIYAGIRRILQAESLAGALVGVAALAFLVNLVELLCTAGIPALYTQILSLQELPRLTYYGFLGLYNLAYILDDTVMVMIAVLTLGSYKLQEKGGQWLKLMSGMVMLGLGAVLLVKPEWLEI